MLQCLTSVPCCAARKVTQEAPINHLNWFTRIQLSRPIDVVYFCCCLGSWGGCTVKVENISWFRLESLGEWWLVLAVPLSLLSVFRPLDSKWTVESFRLTQRTAAHLVLKHENERAKFPQIQSTMEVKYAKWFARVAPSVLIRPPFFFFFFPCPQLPLVDKIRTIAQKVYGADDIELSSDAKAKMDYYNQQVRSLLCLPPTPTPPTCPCFCLCPPPKTVILFSSLCFHTSRATLLCPSAWPKLTCLCPTCLTRRGRPLDSSCQSETCVPALALASFTHSWERYGVWMGNESDFTDLSFPAQVSTVTVKV